MDEVQYGIEKGCKGCKVLGGLCLKGQYLSEQRHPIISCGVRDIVCAGVVDQHVQRPTSLLVGSCKAANALGLCQIKLRANFQISPWVLFPERMHLFHQQSAGCHEACIEQNKSPICSDFRTAEHQENE